MSFFPGGHGGDRDFSHDSSSLSSGYPPFSHFHLDRSISSHQLPAIQPRKHDPAMFPGLSVDGGSTSGQR